MLFATLGKGLINSIPVQVEFQVSEYAIRT
jgi:hypothetical protein